MAIDKNKVVEYCDAYGNHIAIITKNIAYIKRYEAGMGDDKFGYLQIFMTMIFGIWDKLIVKVEWEAQMILL